ncbi:predicted protein [Histoplasma capsulatum var. duboisii H88]|uniref:Predicted protein n=1 Tax=Ajellomyces capsulatus (strain H88) TaxID=544711 RepID=F0UE78_AJEC8|nr:predicted protein [Histoplasma capsulatum var. duboisii H88]
MAQSAADEMKACRLTLRLDSSLPWESNQLQPHSRSALFQQSMHDFLIGARDFGRTKQYGHLWRIQIRGHDNKVAEKGSAYHTISTGQEPTTCWCTGLSILADTSMFLIIIVIPVECSATHPMEDCSKTLSGVFAPTKQKLVPPISLKLVKPRQNHSTQHGMKSWACPGR